MNRLLRVLMLLLAVALCFANVAAQSPASDEKLAQGEKAFEAGNALMEQRKYAEALVRYQDALAVLPNEAPLLFNGGLAAFNTKQYALAADLWKRLKAVEPTDWHARAKLVQAYQALNKLTERDLERGELFEMWRAGNNPELKQQLYYCRDQFQVNDQKLMAFEHFELKGNRALRYVFSILNKGENDEEWRISLGSYDMTNAIWRETREPKPAAGERLFHLDGYFPNGHATYGMYFPEPSYDQVRNQVIQILEGKAKAISSSTVAPAKPKPEASPKP